MKSKKFILLMLAMAIIVSLCGCETSQEEEKEPDSKPSSSLSEVTPEPEPEPDPKTTPEYHFTEAVQERGVLTVGVSGNSKTCYVIPDDPEKYGELAGTRAGNVPEVCRRMAEELGVEVEFVEYATLEAQLQAVTDGDVDLAADNFTITEERLALYEMTDDFNVREIEGDEVFLSTNPQPWLPSEMCIRDRIFGLWGFGVVLVLRGIWVTAIGKIEMDGELFLFLLGTAVLVVALFQKMRRYICAPYRNIPVLNQICLLYTSRCV